MLAPSVTDDLPPPPVRDVNSDVTEIMAYRAGFCDAADGITEQRRAWAYERGYRAGDAFWLAVSATRPYIGEPHFPGWTWEFPNQIPKWMRTWARGREITTIRIARYGRGGDRRSAAFRAAAV